MAERKISEKLRHQPEIKFTEVDIDDKLRLRTLKFIADLDVRIHYSYLLRSNIPSEFRQKKKLKSGHLYTHIIAETLERYLPASDFEFRVFCDQRHLKGIKRSQFKEMLRLHLLPKLPPKSIIQIEMLDSKQSANIQIADWITGALAWHLEKKLLGEECFYSIKNNILGEGLELFKDHWNLHHKKQKTQL